MKRDLQGKVEFIGRHIPEFPGYRAIDHGETDRLLRHYLAGRLAGIRERLADRMAGPSEEEARRAELAAVVQRLARLRESLLSANGASGAAPGAGLVEDEVLLDFDLNLLDKAAALDSALEDAPDGLGALLAGLLDEFEALLAKRHGFFPRAD
ncbi:hypothetical protein [Geoalkalibacter sp.]|uniref:hypothetical protein n=1 Tax=Geoalkalibacter sp. TaxID=3041440 RepID=UPI00272E1649|nr:hypothetical protein [Geoalkalibacter sp.]